MVGFPHQQYDSALRSQQPSQMDSYDMREYLSPR